MTAIRSATARSAEAGTLGALRRLLFWLFLFSAAVLLVELVLLEHTETLLQLLPMFATALAVAMLAWLRVRAGRVAVRLTQVVLVALGAIGLVGLFLHYQANMELELELAPDMAGWELFWESIHGAMPALAPGLMAQLALLGLAYTFRHPALSRQSNTADTEV